MINNLKSYLTQTDNMTSDPRSQTKDRQPNITNRKDIQQHQPQRTEGTRECHTPD
jgi:hypothetical protein